MKTRFLSAAYSEFTDAINYYDYLLPGLGYRFFTEVSYSIEKIKLIPEGWAKIGEKTRRCIIKNFPYSILYVYEKDEIIITAIAHLHRNPTYYTKRIV